MMHFGLFMKDSTVNNIGGNQCVCRGGIWEGGRENPREREVRIDAEFSFMTSATHRSENVSL